MAMYTESIRGYPYMHKEQVAKEFGVSKATVDNRLKEIEEEVKKGRYNDYSIIHDGKLVLINVLVFIDYLAHRQQLRDRNVRKYIPEYKPEVLVQSIGWSNRTVIEEDSL